MIEYVHKHLVTLEKSLVTYKEISKRIYLSKFIK